MNKLGSSITATGIKLGDTLGGSNWCMKALNPAAPLTETNYPDGGTASRVLQHYERTVTGSYAAAAANWTLTILQRANPAVFGSLMTDDGVTPVMTPVLNTQLAADYTNIRSFLIANCEAYRIVYSSITCVMDATSVTNSGMVAAANYISPPARLNRDETVAFYIRRPVLAWPDPPKSYDTLVQVPGAYLGEAKDGVYVPFRLESFRWGKPNNLFLPLYTADATSMNLGLGTFTGAPLPVGPSVPDWPYGLTGMSQTNYGDGNIFEETEDCMSHVVFRNLNPAANIRITFRVGIEYIVPPATVLSPNMRLPPLYDPAALNAYKIVSSQLKQGYPAEYNDWQKILGVISNIAKTVLPMIPGAAPLTSLVPLAEKGILNIGKKISAKRAAKKKILPARK